MWEMARVFLWFLKNILLLLPPPDPDHDKLLQDGWMDNFKYTYTFMERWDCVEKHIGLLMWIQIEDIYNKSNCRKEELSEVKSAIRIRGLSTVNSSTSGIDQLLTPITNEYWQGRKIFAASLNSDLRAADTLKRFLKLAAEE